mmetsp:Transcript_8716/g.24190  ORF Transcript_8716/g.24190 Transcript_8716/m.24190 type:complete len:89 (+) Transcript_8716:1603-1869(+)|eukprot:scaffold128434_cov34-Tisochrysis_lutea.AAC.4
MGGVHRDRLPAPPFEETGCTKLVAAVGHAGQTRWLQAYSACVVLRREVPVSPSVGSTGMLKLSPAPAREGVEGSKCCDADCKAGGDGS